MVKSAYYVKLLGKYLLKYYIEILLILIIPLIALRTFLFTPGYYFYADQGWPLSNNIYATGVLSLNSLSGFSFSRIIIDWPYYVLTLFTSSVMVTERIFIYYTFSLYTFVAYIFSTMITRRFLKNKNKYEVIAVKFIIVLFIFSNFTALNLNADGGSFSDSLNIVFIAIILLAFISWKNMRLVFLISSILLTVSILLEPDYTTFYIISIMIGSVIAGLINKDFIYRFKYALLTIISSVIPVSFVVLDLLLTATMGSSLSAVGALRVYNYGAISFFSGNINPLYPLILMGHSWSTIVYAPPSVLFYGNEISSVKALMHPSQLLLPTGFITYLWLFTLIMIPVISLVSIIFKNTRRIAFPVFFLFLLFYTMSLVYYIKPLFYLEMYMSNIPIIGGAIGTTLALPGHVINVIASMYYILFSITLVNLVNTKVNFKFESDKDNFNFNIKVRKKYIENYKGKAYLRNNKFQLFVIVFIVFIVLFSGWQAFDGSFYPARAPDTAYGNNVANIGGYTPLMINSSVIHAYDFISSQNSNFNILWIGGPAFSNRVYASPHPTATIPELNYITSNNMTNDFYYNLLYSGTKYVVISNQDIQKNPGALFELTFSDAGFTNFTSAQNFLKNTSGLKEVYSKYQVDIFEVIGFRSIYKSNLLLNYEGNSNYESSLPYLFKTLGYKASLTSYSSYGLPVCFDNNSRDVSIDTPVYLANILSSSNANYKDYNMSSDTTLSGAGHNYGTGLPDNFTLSLWSGNETYYSYSNGELNITNNHSSSLQTVSYNGSFDSGAGGYYVNNHYINLTVSFYVKSNNPGQGQIIFMGEPKSNISTDNIWNATNFNTSSVFKKYIFSYIFPDTEAYADFRLYDYIDGSFILKNLTTKYEILPSIRENATLPFGDYVLLNNTMLKGNNENALLYMANGTIKDYEWIKFNFAKGLYINNDTKIAAMILVKNNITFNNSNSTFVVSIYTSSNEYKLSYDNKIYESIPGIYEDSIFIINKNVDSLNDVKIVTEGVGLMDIFYVGIVAFLGVLTYLFFITYKKNLKR